MPVSRNAPSMADVAARVGVSHQTVSRVLNGSALVREETRMRVLSAVEEMGYRRNSAARSLVTNRSSRLGVIAAHLALHGPSRMASTIDDAARAAGYDISLIGLEEVSPASLHAAVDRLLDQAVEAVLVAAAHGPAIALVQEMSLPVPLVVVQGAAPGQPLAVGIDQRAGARAAVAHLLDLGHERVAHISGPEDWVEAVQRREGWELEHRERGLVPGPLLVGDWSARGGHGAARRLLENPEVTAIFAANDATAVGALKALHDAGRAVPAQVSIVGFDDAPESEFAWPALTTVRQDFAVLGREAVALALRAIEGDAEPMIPLVPAQLVVRDSTASVRER